MGRALHRAGRMITRTGTELFSLPSQQKVMMLPQASAKQQELIKWNKLRLRSHKTAFHSSSSSVLTVAVMAVGKISFVVSWFSQRQEKKSTIHNSLVKLTCSTACSSSHPCSQKEQEMCKETELKGGSTSHLP